jgi:hypothetical protein
MVAVNRNGGGKKGNTRGRNLVSAELMRKRVLLIYIDEVDIPKKRLLALTSVQEKS